MKIRNGYVSNSSSSSFIVMWKKKPESWEEVKNVLFPDMDSIDFWDQKISTDTISKTVYTDTEKANINDIKEEQTFYLHNSNNRLQWWSKGYNWENYTKDMKEIEELELSKPDFNQYTLHRKIDEMIETNPGIENSILRKRKYKKINDTSEDFTEIEETFIKLNEDWELIRALDIKMDKMLDKLQERSAKDFIKKYDKYFVAKYEYGDNVYENGDIFDNLDHIRTSHH